MKRFMKAVVYGAIALSFQCVNVSGATITDFVDYSEPELPGRLFIPPEASEDARPVILYLHGAGEQGDDNIRQVGRHIDNLLEVAKDRGAFIYAPQAIADSGIHNWNDSARTSMVMDKLNEVLADHNTDPTRVYITGISMGGGGTWNMVDRFPMTFAAAAPMAGVRPDASFDPGNILGTPTWAFHARDDNVITKERSRTVINGILTAAGEPSISFPGDSDTTSTFSYVNDDLQLRYTEYPTGGHRIWGSVFAQPEFADWMFAQSVPEPSANLLIALAIVGVFSLSRQRVTGR